MNNIGYLAIVIALVAAIYSAVCFAVGTRTNSLKLMHSARNALMAVFGLVSISVALLAYFIFSHNFSYEYVASYTSINTSPLYLLSALWAGNSGSLLFWAWLLAVFSFIVILTKRKTDKDLMPWVSVVLMVTQVFFLLLLVAVTNPFDKLAVIPADGYGLNPMLQNMGMVFHPPALLAGYVAFTIPFAFGIASLVMGKTGQEWLLAARKWSLLAWLLLGVGNIIGMWWAYVELGWGGYWAWDPVENAGLMPWLVATAFLHASIIQRRKGIFKIWNLFFIILAFSLVIFGTFLTRSGMLSSVHTFNDTGMAPYFIVFIGMILVGSFGLLYFRSDALKRSGTESLISRESSFLLTILLLLASTMLILIGTVYPAFREAFTGAKLSLNATFFNTVNGPLFFLIILTVGICTVIGWKHSSLYQLFKKVLWPLVAAVIVAIVILILWVRDPIVLVGIFVLTFVLSSIIKEFIRAANVRNKIRGGGYLKSWLTLIGSNSQRYGGYIVHTGIVLMALGIIASSFYGTNKEETLKIGDSIEIKQYSVKYEGLTSRDTPDKTILTATLSVYQSGKFIKLMNAEKYFQKSQQQSVTEVAIRSTPIDDLYIILQDWSDNGATADFKVLVNPLVLWIWIGGGIFLIGGLITFWPFNKSNLVQASQDKNNE